MNKLLIAAVFAAVNLASIASPIGDALQPFVDKGLLPGAINVYINGTNVEETCVGWADVEAKRPITMDDPYMQCSQTKGFCGVTIAMLVEEGKISLDDPVSKYLPEFKEMWVYAGDTNDTRTLRRATTPITIRMVMNHTAGFDFELPEYGTMGGWSRRMPLRSVAIFASKVPLMSEPGTKVRYSNIGIDVGAVVVEVVTGKRWEDFLQERVLNPLGMSHSTFWPTDEQIENRIKYYKIFPDVPAKFYRDNWRMQMPYNGKFVFASAGAGLWTTARDQLKFYKMLMNLGVAEDDTRLLKEETVKNLLAVSTRPKNFEGYSLGLNAPKEDNEDGWFGHGGAWGTQAEVNWHKKQLKLWVVQQEGRARQWQDARDKTANEFFKTVLDTSALDAYTGRVE